MRRSARSLTALILLLAFLLGASACAGGSPGPGSSTPASADPAGGPASGSQVIAPVESTTTTLPSVAKVVASDGSVALGSPSADGFTLSFPADGFAGVAQASATRAPSSAAPAMEYAMVLGDGYQVDTGGVGRLDDGATLTLVYDPAKTADPMLLSLGYFDGTSWTYVFAARADTNAHTATFPIFHFSAYYPAQFTSELEAAKYYAAQMAAQKVLGEKGGDPKVASQALADLLASKLGLGGDEFSRKMLKDIAGDQDIVKVFDEYQTKGWTDTGYQYVMDFMCGKVAQRLSAANKDPAGLGLSGDALGNMWDILKAGNAGSKFLGFVLEGDAADAGKELFDLATDYTGVPGKAIKYTLAGMQNAVDVWRDGEVEKAFRVYTKGSSGSLFGYGAVDPGNIDEVWNNMKGAARQLCIERIDRENKARATAGMPPLSAVEEDFYREKVKTELKSEFDRRIELDAEIKAQEKNLDAILNEPYLAELLKENTIFLRDKSALSDTLSDRLNRFNHLIGRIFKDLEVDTVYSGPQQKGDLNGRISSVAMAEMIRGYFSANTQGEAEKFLQEYYSAKLGVNVGEAAVEGIYNVEQTVTYDGSDDQFAPFQARVELDGTTAKVSFKTFVLQGTYNPDTGQLVGKDRNMPSDPMDVSWWHQANTTIQFNLGTSPVTGLGKVSLKMGTHSLTVTITLTRVSDL